MEWRGMGTFCFFLAHTTDIYVTNVSAFLQYLCIICGNVRYPVDKQHIQLDIECVRMKCHYARYVASSNKGRCWNSSTFM
jgi:hypothetical protein